MENNIKVSVIIPVYNVEKYLNRCLDSLLSQTLEEIEIIAVDDLSTDQSYNILKQYENKYPNKIKAFQLPEKGRQGGARNFGIRKSRGKYIGFVDSDDYVEADMYEVLYNLANNLDVDMAYGGYYEDYGKYKESILASSNLGNEKTIIQISEKNREDFLVDMCPFWCCIFNADLILKNNIFFPERLAYEDNYFGVVVKYFIKSIAYTKKTLYCYNKNNIRSTTSIRNSSYHLDRIKTAEMTLSFFKECEDYKQIKRAVEYIYFEHYYLHTISCIIYYYDKTDYELIKKIRNKFKKEFPEYKSNNYYINRFGKNKRIVFSIIEWSPYLYVNIYKLFRIINRKIKI